MADLLDRIPLAQNHLVHAERRRSWPASCGPALDLLHDKQRLLELAPLAWVLPHLLLPPEASADAVGSPGWWADGLRGDGLVLKPCRGHGGQGVIHYRWERGKPVARALFAANPGPMPAPAGDLSPLGLAADWRRRTGCRQTAIAQPYAAHGAQLPAADPSVVLRVITERRSPEAPVVVGQAWLEIPFPGQRGDRGEGSDVLLLGLDGAMPPIPGPATDPLLADARRAWRDVLRHPPAVLSYCLEASLEMHRRLPPIDAVAWDWIPASGGPILLEGNGGFSLLEPQLLQQSGGPR